MSLIQSITDFLDFLFRRSSPEVQKKQLMKKMEMEIKEYFPLICSNGMLQPNFGEAINILYRNSIPLDNLFSQTVSPNDMPRQHRFEAQLIMTAYPVDEQALLEALSFQNRKEEIIADYQNSDRIYIRQKQRLEKVLRDLNGPNFNKMDSDILNLRQFVDFCHYNYVPFLQIFDRNFEAENPNYTPKYSEIPISKSLNLLEDLYYQISGLKITNATSDAVLALAKLRKNAELTPAEEKSYVSNLKKIHYIINKVISPEKIKCLIRLAKLDPNYEPALASYSGSPRQEFANMLQSKFDADEQRIKSDIQDEKITQDVGALFSGTPMEEIYAYNQQYNFLLQNDTALSFQWILPLRILKTFLKMYISPSVKTLLNDIVIEGFFNSPTYKTNFSQIVYSCIGAEADFEAFEKTFENSQPNSIAVMESYIRDSKKDKEFYKKLEKMVVTMNNQAHALLQNTVTNLNYLHKELGELLADAKKPSSEIISNLKVLVMSSRNRDNTILLEQQYANWKIFFDIMKNYVIINSGDVQ